VTLFIRPPFPILRGLGLACPSELPLSGLFSPFPLERTLRHGAPIRNGKRKCFGFGAFFH